MSDDELSQDDIEKLMSGGGDAPAGGAPEEAAAEGGDLSQDEIEKLMGGGDSPPAAAATEDSGGDMSQDEIEKLMAGGAATPPAAEADDAGGDLSQDEIEKLMAGGGSAPAPAAESDSGAELSQDEIENLLAGGGAAAPAAPAAEGSPELSQSEIEHLLSSLSGPEAAAKPQPKGKAAAPTPSPLGKVALYDFKRPERVGKDQMRAMQSLHEGFGRNFASKLSAMLRTLVEVHLVSVDQMTYSEFILALESPTCFNVLRPEPLEGNFLLDICPDILFPLIDRMLGGGKERSQIQQRAITEIERRLVTRITRMFMEELQTAWESLIKLTPSLERIESNPQLAQVVPPNEVVVVLSFEATLLGYKGVMSLCIPYNSIERISNKLSQNTWAAYGGGEATEESQSMVSHNLRAARVEVRVELARTSISTADLIGLGVGDVITTEKDVGSPLILMVEGAKKYRCTAGAFKGRKAVRVVGPIAEDPGAALRLS